MTKTVTIQIDRDDLHTLKPKTGTPYNLCFARKVGTTFNVIWQSGVNYGPTNDFSWDPVFALFATNTFQPGIKVSNTSNILPIALGQQSTLDNTISLSDPTVDQTGDVDPNSIIMNNTFGPIHAGLSALSTFGGTTSTTPMFVSPDADTVGSIKLTPKEAVKVWFQRDIETSAMFEDSQSLGVEIDLTHESAATRLYKGGSWHTPAKQSGLEFLRRPVFVETEQKAFERMGNHSDFSLDMRRRGCTSRRSHGSMALSSCQS